MAQLGVYVGNSKTALTTFETWLGRPVDGVLGYISQASWSDFTNSAAWAASTQMWEGSNRQVFWSVPLIVSGATLSDGAAGKYNAYYKQVATSLLGYDHNPADSIYIRTGWEFNGNWMPWAAAGQPENFKGAFRQFVQSFEAVSDRFKFEWNVNIQKQAIDPELAYPGDDVVDVIGMDFYWDPQWFGTDGTKAFQIMRDDPRGLQWLKNFAEAHSKPTAYSEWGVHESVDGTQFVKLVDQWFDSYPVVYQTYWDSNSAFPGKISDNSDPDTGAAYKLAFSDAALVSPPADQSMKTDGVTVWSSISFDLTGRSELNLVLTGTAAINGTGNTLNNTITGNGASNTLSGGDGGDTIAGGGGDDSLAGGAGIDTVSFGSAAGAVTVNLETKTATGEGSDTLSNLENVTGSNFDDSLTGDAVANLLAGGGGNDVLKGGLGNDTLSGAAGNDTLTGGPGGDALSGGAGLDWYVFSVGSSGITSATVDSIDQWSASAKVQGDDKIDMPIAGTPKNYAEASTTATTIENAAVAAESLFPSSSIRHVFLYNSSTNIGYLLSDLDNNSAFETGVILSQIGGQQASAMSYQHIL